MGCIRCIMRLLSREWVGDLPGGVTSGIGKPTDTTAEAWRSYTPSGRLGGVQYRAHLPWHAHLGPHGWTAPSQQANAAWPPAHIGRSGT